MKQRIFTLRPRRHRLLFTFASLCIFTFCSWAAPFSFIVAGDSRGSDNGINMKVLSELRDAFLKEKPDLVIFPGDLVSGPRDHSGLMSYFSNWVAIFHAPLRDAGIPVYPVRGNHDLTKDDDNARSWNETFSNELLLPQNGPDGEKNLTYAVAHKTALFIGLDVYISGRTGIAAEAWARSIAATNKLPHVFAFTHVPLFPLAGKGAHADGYAYDRTEKRTRTDVRNSFVDMLSSHGVVAYFCGHDHWFDAAYVSLPSGRPFYQMLSGGAGAPIRTWEGSNYQDSMVSNIVHFDDFGYLVVTIDGPTVVMVPKRRVAENSFEERGRITYTR